MLSFGLAAITVVVFFLVPGKGPKYCADHIEESKKYDLSLLEKKSSIYTRVYEGQWLTAIVYKNTEKTKKIKKTKKLKKKTSMQEALVADGKIEVEVEVEVDELFTFICYFKDNSYVIDSIEKYAGDKTEIVKNYSRSAANPLTLF